MRTTTTLLLGFALSGCLVDPSTESTTTQESRSFNALAGNALAGNALAMNALAGNALAGNALAGNALAGNALAANQLSAPELFGNPEGRSLYSYIVSCALPSTTTVIASVTDAPDVTTGPYTCSSANDTCSFPGGLGLASHWASHRLRNDGEGWVSACLLARVNAHTTAEAISLRGRSDGLALGAGEITEFVLEEGAFYGNVFGGAMDWNACRGLGEASGGGGGLGLRDCAEPDLTKPGKTLCGFNYAGDCRDFSPEFASPYACRTFNSDQGIYGDCHSDSGNGRWSTRKYRQAITVFVAP